jgi:hypothetical protein
VRDTLYVGLILSFVVMMSVLGAGDASADSPTLITRDMRGASSSSATTARQRARLHLLPDDRGRLVLPAPACAAGGDRAQVSILWLPRIAVLLLFAGSSSAAVQPADLVRRGGLVLPQSCPRAGLPLVGQDPARRPAMDATVSI